MLNSLFPSHWSTLKKLIWLKAAQGGGGGLTTLTGSIVSFIASKAKAINKIEVEIESQQSGSGDPSPTNIRPITGATGVKVTRAAEHNFLIPKNTSVFPMSLSGITVDYVGNGKYHIHGTASVAIETDWISVEPFTTPTTGVLNLNNSVDVGSSKKIFFGRTTGSAFDSWNLTPKNRVITSLGVTGGKNLARFYFTLPAGTWDFTLQPEFYADQSSTSNRSVTFPDTVYGGTLTINEDGSVDLVSTMANIASYNGETINEPWLSSMDKYISGATPTTEAQVVYTLSSPITYHLDSIEALYTLVGQNNIWVDCSDNIAVTIPSSILTSENPITDIGTADSMILTE